MNSQDVYVPHVGWMKFPVEDEVATLIREGHFELPEQIFFNFFLREGDVFVDGGAHSGFFSRIADSIIGKSGRIFAFEPNPSTHAILKENLGPENVDAVIELIPKALWKEECFIFFHMHNDELSSHDHIDIVGSHGQATVEAVSLDGFSKINDLSEITFLKLDCEGAEVEVLRGAESLLNEGRLRCATVEFSEHNLARLGYSTEELFRAGEVYGYAFYRFDPIQNTIEPIQFTGPIYYENLILTNDIKFIRERIKKASDNAKRIGEDLVSRIHATRSIKDLENLETYRERAEQLSEAKRWAENTDRLLVLERKKTDQFDRVKEWAENTERLLAVERETVAGLKKELKVLKRKLGIFMPTVVEQEAANLVSEKSSVAVQVVICAARPRLDVLRFVLEGLSKQTLDVSEWSLCFVNNAPDDPSVDRLLEETELGFRYEILHEPNPGLIHARLCAIRNTHSPLYVFVDDDTVLEQDYLENALKLATTRPELGAFGGKSRGIYEREPGKWFRLVEQYVAVRDYGDAEICSPDNYEWGRWEPVGAGMVVTREVCEEFLDFCEESHDAKNLGRKGTALMSGEDTAMARMAYRLNLKCSYIPSLRLEHWIAPRRTKVCYMCRILSGHGASFYSIQKAFGEKPYYISKKFIVKKMLYRFWKKGRAGIVRTFWEIGYRRAYLEDKS